MVRTPARCVIGMASIVCALLIFTDTAWGRTSAPVVDPAKAPLASILLTPNSGPPGTRVKVRGSGFGSQERVRIQFVDSVHGPASLGSARTDTTGRFSKKVTIPADATTG